jgi:steroid 5-alpha reductase family enzyme
MRRRDQISIFGIVATIVVGGFVTFAGSQESVDVSVGSTGIAVFAISALVAYAINWLVFIPSYAARTEAYFDLTGSLTYISVTAVALLGSDDVDARAVIVAALVVVWALRLGTFLFRRVRRDGGDGRFDWIKTNPLRFFMTWSLQALWVLLTLACSLAVITTKERDDIDVFLFVGLAV